IAAGSVSAGTAFASALFPAPADVAAGTQYALVAWSSTPNSNKYVWADDGGTNAYPGNTSYFFGGSPPTTTWFARPTRDQAFKTYTASSQPAGAAPSQPGSAPKKCKKKKGAKKGKKCKKPKKH